MPDRPADDGLTLTRRAVLGGGAALTAGCLGAGSACQAAAGQRFRVTDYGAVGNGDAQQDTLGIQRAIDTAARQGGGAIVFDRPRRFYALSRSLILRSGVSLEGDGSYPEIRAEDPRVRPLLPGNLHPVFLAKARFDPLARPAAGARVVKLAAARDAARYRPGDQVLVTSRQWGRTGPYGLPHFSWLNIVTRVEGAMVHLREPIDRSVDAQITLLRDTGGLDHIPLFFYSDASITGLSLFATTHVMMDTAMLRVRFEDNRTTARSAIYGNSFQRCVWRNNRFRFTTVVGEQSLNSFGNLVEGNDFAFARDSRPAPHGENFFGLYLQEYARDIIVRDNRIDMGDFPPPNALISIGKAQNVVIERLAAKARHVSTLISMGSPSDPDFPVSGNFVRDCTFDTGSSTRFAMVMGHGDRGMTGNGIVDCRFLGQSKSADAFRIEDVKGDFTFDGNYWEGPGECQSMRQSTTVRGQRNRRALNGKTDCRTVN